MAEGLLHSNLYKKQFLCLGSFCISIWKGEYQPSVLHKLTLIIMKTHTYLAAALSWIICQVMHIHDIIRPQHNPKGRDGYSDTKDKDAEGAGHVKDKALPDLPAHAFTFTELCRWYDISTTGGLSKIDSWASPQPYRIKTLEVTPLTKDSILQSWLKCG